MSATRLVQRGRRPSAPRRGAASLAVVMILFFVITLVAAYTSRNLLFEQRTSANIYRASLAQEAAEAGVEWAIARLNEGRMNDDCTVASTIASPPQPTFRERYLDINATTGAITALPSGGEKLAGCIFNGTGWVCHCPDTGNPAPTVTLNGSGPFPAFWVKFRNNQLGTPQRQGVVRIQVNGCTRADVSCLSFDVAGGTHEAQTGDGLATVWAMLALRSAMPTAPAAALTVRGTFDPPSSGGDHPSVSNTDTVSGGFTIHGSTTTGNFTAASNFGNITLQTVPGTPTSVSVIQNDPGLTFSNLTLTPATPENTAANSGGNRMFNSFFGTWPATYFDQPALKLSTPVDCTSGCNAAGVNAVVQRRPGQPVRVTGGGTLRIDANVGSASAPVLIITDGPVEFGSGTPTLYGVVYSSAATWQMQGNGTIRGAAIAERNFRFEDDDPAIVYDRDVILQVQRKTGTFTKVPGSWRDYQWGPNP